MSAQGVVNVKVILTGITAVVNIILFVTTIQEANKVKRKLISKPLVAVALVILLFQCLGWGLASLRLAIWGDSTENTSDVNNFVVAVSAIFTGVSTYLCYLFMAFQLHFVFRNTPSAVQKRTIYCHLLVFVIALINGFGVYGFAYISPDLAALSLLFGFFIFIGGISHMTWVFNRKLYSIILNSEGLKEIDIGIIKVITRTNLLITTILVGALLVSIFSVIKEATGSVAMIILYELVWTGWCISTVFCIFAMLSVNKAYYETTCSCCDSCMMKICQRLTKTNISDTKMLQVVSDSKLQTKTLEFNSNISSNISSDNDITHGSSGIDITQETHSVGIDRKITITSVSN